MTPLKFIRESRKWKVFKKIKVYFSWGSAAASIFSGAIYIIASNNGSGEDFGYEILIGLFLVLIAAFPAFLYYVWHFQIAPFIDRSVYDPAALEIDEDYRGKFRNDYFKIIAACVLLSSLILWPLTSWSDPFSQITRNINEGLLVGIWIGLPLAILLLSVGLFALLTKLLPELYNAVDEEEEMVQSPELQLDTKSIGILPFEDLSLQPNPKLDVLGDRAPTWLSREINKHQLAESYDFPSFLKEYQSIDGLTETAIREKFNRMPHKRLIKGSYQEENNRLLLHSEIKDRISHKTLKVIEVNAPVEDLSKAMHELSEKVLGWLAREDKKELILEQKPISYRAFLHLEKAKEFYHDPQIFLTELEKSLKIDPNYFEPKILRVGYYFNVQEIEKADECLKELEHTIEDRDTRQKNLILLYRSLLIQDYAKAYTYMKEEYIQAPRDLQTNTSVMSMALFYVNKPTDIEAYFNQIPMSKEEIRQSEFCRDRLYLRAWSLVLNKYYNPAMDLLRSHLQSPGYRRLKEVFLTAQIRSRQFKKVDDSLKRFELLDQTSAGILAKLYLKTGLEFLLVGEQSRARQCFLKILELPKEEYGEEVRLKALFHSGNHSAFLAEWPQNDPNHLARLEQAGLKGLRSIALAQNGQLDLAEGLFEGSKGLIDATNTYAAAQFNAFLGQEDKALRLLRKALDQGHFYTRSSFSNDPILSTLHSRSDYHQLLRLRH